MTPPQPSLRLSAGIVVERRKASSPWAEFLWRPSAVLAAAPAAAPWSLLSDDGQTATFYAGAAEIELHRTETDGYRRNLKSACPAIWVALHETAGEPPYAIAAVTVDPAEGEGLTEPGHGIIEALAMPEPLRQAIAAFVTDHPRAAAFEKRRRDRADPEALARRGAVSPKPR